MDGNIAMIMLANDKVFLGYSTNNSTRHSATSGGVGSSIVKFMFDSMRVNSCMCFTFDRNELRYIPKIITNVNDYELSGSIYHEVDVISFIKSNIDLIKSPFICFALPCQTKAIKFLLEKANIVSYIIELTCSSQQSYEATEYLLKRLNISKPNIAYIRYRGDGWPSGTRIVTKLGAEIMSPEINALWTEIFHSRLFIMPRCFLCNPHIYTQSDIVLADPWGIDTPGLETNGRTLCLLKSQEMDEIICEMSNNGLIAIEKIENSKFTLSQAFTINRKNALQKHRKIGRIMRLAFTNKYYRRIMTYNASFFKLHCMIKKLIEKTIA